MTRVLVVGRGYIGITEHLRAHGYDYNILEDRLTSSNHTSSERRVLADFSTRASVLAALRDLPKKPDAVLTIYENYVLPTAWIAEHLQLSGMPVDAAIACTDKWIMRQALARAPKPLNPAFEIVRSEADLIQFATDHGFPLMLKPANLVKSLLVTKNDSLDELLANYRHTVSTIDEVYKKHAQNRQPTIIVEEFLVGSMHTVAGFADQFGEPYLVDEIVDLQMAREVGFSDNFLYNRLLPSSLSDTEQAVLRETACMGIRALGMKSSPAHVEMILTPKGPRVVEIGARNGGYRGRMYNLANGIDLVGASLAVALGKLPALTASKHEPCAVLELFPRQPGIFVEIKHMNEITKLPSCAYFGVKIAAGTFVGKAADGFKRCAIIILHHANRAQFEADLGFVNRLARVVTQAS